MTFLQWVIKYYNVINNLYGKDRDEAIRAIDDDDAFDRWEKSYSRKQAMEAAGKGDKAPVTKEGFVKKLGREFGPGDFEKKGK